MKKFLQLLTISAVLMLASIAANAQNVGIGTAAPAQKLEIAGTQNTIRINGLKTGGLYSTAANSTSQLMYVNNSTGDVYSLPSGTAGAILTISATGVPTWSTGATSATAWQLTGNNNGTYTFNATPTTYLGTTSATAGFQFGVGGVNAGRVESTNGNVALGYQSLNATTTGTNNVAIGDQALKTSITAASNVAVGKFALEVSTVSQNVGVGDSALVANSTGTQNTAIGYQTSVANTTSSDNTSVGYQALQKNNTSQNTAIGDQALQNNATGQNTAVGYQAAQSNTSGSDLTALGAFALQTNTTGTDNTALGYIAGGGGSGIQNTTVGSESGFSLTSGGNNTSVGYLAYGGDIGSNNTSIGSQVLANIFDGTAYSGNTAVGSNALYNLNAGNDNTFIGYNSQASSSGGTSNGTALGYNTIAGSNATAIGYEAKATQANSLILGAINGVNGATANTSVGIGTITPAQTLEIGLTTGTIRIDALKTGDSYSTATAASTSNLLFANNTTGDIYALTNGTAGEVLTITSGVPTWTTPAATSATAWQLTGNNNGTYTFSAAPNPYLGTTSATAGFQFGVGGVNAGRVESTNANTALGYQTLNVNTATGNTAFGYQALVANTSGTNNTAVGYQSLGANTTGGVRNTALGYQAGLNVTTGTDNIAIGYEDENGGGAITGSDNIGIGSNTFQDGALSGSHNIAIGEYALNSMYLAGTGNVAVGYNAFQGGYPATNPSNYNTAIGFNALADAEYTAGTSNDVAVGAFVLYESTGGNNAAVGDSALYNGGGAYNAVLGTGALLGVVGGSANDNVAIGYEAIHYDNGSSPGSAGGSNTAVGYRAMYDNHGGNFNAAFGLQALQNASNASNNTAIGTFALQNNTSGTNNVALGYEAGGGSNYSVTANTTGSNNTFIGYDASSGTATQYSNATAIGANAAVSQSNSLVLGSISGVNGASASVNVGIGTTAPGVKVDVAGLGAANVDLRVTGRIQSGDGAGNGGIWFNSANTLFAGNDGGNIGLYAAPVGWNIIMQATNGYTSIGTGAIANRMLEVGGLTNTIRNDGLATGGSFITTPSASTDKVMYADLNGDIRAITPGATGSILALNASGIPTWTSASAATNAWNVTGGNATAAYTFAASPTTYLGTNASGGAGFQFGVGGINAGRVESTNQNTALGYQSLNVNTAVGNTAIGYQALLANTSGTDNVAIGDQALGAVTTGGARDIGIGNQAGYSYTTGTDDISIGYQAGYYSGPYTGSDNIAIGSYAFEGIGGTMTASHNITMGYYTMDEMVSGSYNLGLGYESMVNDVYGSYNVALGYLSLENVGQTTTGETGNNVGIGTTAGANITTGTYNIAIGGGAQGSSTSANLTGSGNIGIGGLAEGYLTTGTGNTAIGYAALEDYQGGTGSNNTAIGYFAQAFETTGSNNTSVGYQADYNSAAPNSGSNNTAMGWDALNNNITGSDNAAFGYNANVATSALSNATAIGYNASVAQSNSMALGGIGANSVEVGVGTSTPEAYMDIVGGAPFGGGGTPDIAFEYNGGGTGGYRHFIQSRHNSTVSGTGNDIDFYLNSSTSGTGSSAIGTGNIQVLTLDANGSTGTALPRIGIGTLAPARELELNGSNANSTIRVDAFATGGTFLTTPATASNLVVSNNVNGDLSAVINGASGSILTMNASGVPTWATPVASPTAWYLTGNSGTTPGTNFIGTTDAAALMFKAQDTIAGILDLTNRNAYFGTASGNYGGGATNSVAVGYHAGSANTVAGNQFVGYRAGENNTSGTSNQFEGYKAGASNTASFNNLFMGYEAGVSEAGNGSSASPVFPGSDNQFVGTSAGANNTNGYFNLFEGYSAGYGNITGIYNTAIGPDAFAGGTDNGLLNPFVTPFPYVNTGDFNVAVGEAALYGNSGGYNNTGVGVQVLYGNASGSDNTAMGEQALNGGGSTDEGSNNTAIGYQAMYWEVPGSNNNTAMGWFAGGSINGNNNVAIGDSAYSGYYNVANNYGNYNVAIGSASLMLEVNGASNVAIGRDALYSNTVSQTVGVGDSAMYNNSTGTNNTAVGYQALITNTTGSSNTAVGYQANVSSAALSNATAVGANATVSASNTVKLGNSTNVQFDLALMPGGNAGLANQVLQSNGAGAAPTWVTPAATSATAWQLTGNSGTTAGTNFLGTTDAHDLVFKTAGTENMRIANSTGDVGISTPTPNSTLDVNGSMSVKVAFATSSSAYTVGSGDYIIEANCSTGPVTVNLPDATTMQGRLYLIVATNVSGSNIVTVNTFSGSQSIGGYGNSITLQNSYEQEYIASDGANWLVIGSSKM